MVRDPSQQGWLPGALGLCRHHGCDERADVRARPARGGARRRLALRLDLAARSAVGACRYRGHRRAARADVQRAVRERAHAHPHEEHGVRRRAGRAARARPRRHRGIDQGDLCAQARAHRVEPASDRLRARLCACASRMSAAAPREGARQDGRPHHDRRQYGRGFGLRLCRRDGRGLVSDHSVDVADGRVPVVLRALSQGSAVGRAAVLRRPGRGRARGDRHRARRHLERRARFHADERSRIVADERVLRLRVFHRAACRAVRRAARRPVDGHADAYPAGRFAVGRLCFARRHETRVAVPA